VIAWSSGAELLLGWPRDEAVGHSADEIFSGAVHPLDEPWEGRLTLRRKDGSAVRAHVIDAPLRSRDGRAETIVRVAAPLGDGVTTARRREEALRESEKRVRLVLDETETGAWQWDMETNEVRCSENFGAIHGLPSGEQPATYEAFLELVHPVDRERVAEAVRRALEEGTGYELELQTIRPDGESRWVWTRASLLTDAKGRPQSFVGISRDITEQKRAEAARGFLAEATDALFGSLDLEQMLMQVAELAIRRLSDWCSVDLLDEEGRLVSVAVAHVDPEKVSLARELRERYPPDPDAATGAPNVIRTGRSELYREISQELLEETVRDEEQLRILRNLGLRSAMVVPLEARGRAFGAIIFVSAESRRIYGDDDLALAEELGRRAAVAIDNVRLHTATERALAAAERARHRIARLQSVTEGLAAAVTETEIAAVVVEQGTGALSADRGLAYVVREDSSLELVGHTGYPDELLDGWRRVRLDASNPTSDIVRTGEMLVLESREDMDARYPMLRDFCEGAGDSAVVAAPVTIGPRTVGALLFTFGLPRQIDPGERALALTIARQFGQSLERARLYEDERGSRERVERLQAVTSGLSAALTPAEIAAVALEQGMQALEADTSALAVVDQTGGALEIVGYSGYSDEIMDEWRRIDIGDDLPICEAVRARRALFFQTAEELLGRYPDLRPILEGTGGESWAAVPLLLARSALGVLFYGSRRPNRFRADDRALVATLAEQCALALDRARRYATEREIAETLQRSILPERLPELEGVEVAARYAPGATGTEVGGDWYDVIPLPKYRVGLVVGDVVGKGVRAASTMAQLRNALRAYALEGFKPSSALARLNRLVESVGMGTFTTVLFASLDRRTGICRYASAGHPPALLRRPDGRVAFLEGGSSLPVGALSDTAYRQGIVHLGQGATLVLYTDGLVERRDSTLAEGLARLERAAATDPGDVEAFVDRLLAGALGEGGNEDDLALLAVKYLGNVVPPLELRLAPDQASLQTMRGTLSNWLSRVGATPDDTYAILLASWEACANAMEHPVDPARPVIELDARRSGDAVSISVRDYGHWREGAEREDQGLGLRLMGGLMEDVDVSVGSAGTEVRMRRRIGPVP